MKRPTGVAVSTLAVLVLGAAVWWLGFRSAEDPLPPEVAVEVHGERLLWKNLDFLATLAPHVSRDEYIEDWIDDRLLNHYGERRRLAPSDDEVRRALAEVRTQIDPEDLRKRLEATAAHGGPATEDAYWNDPNLFKSYRRSITIDRARQVIVNQPVPGTYDEVLEAGLAKLREEAKIRRNPDPTPP
ncbi:MAG: hypothetical protein ACKVVT_11800 [Dehalococcoidia bacterium]